MSLLSASPENVLATFSRAARSFISRSSNVGI